MDFEIRRREPEMKPVAFPVDHLAEHAERPAEACLSFLDLPFHKKFADPGTRDRSPPQLHGLHLPEKESARLREAFHELRVSFPAAAKMGVLAHADLTDMKFLHKDLFHKIPGRHF